MTTLLIGYGNPARGDDALGPMLIERLEEWADAETQWGVVRFQVEYQLQIEHALDLVDCDRVLFIDASVDCPMPFGLSRVHAAQHLPRSTHSVLPGELLRVYAEVEQCPPPESWLLAIRGDCFDLGEGLSDPAQLNLQAAEACVHGLLDTGMSAA